MKKWLACVMLLGTVAAPRAAAADYYVEYYRDNLFLGLAYHRIGCLTDWFTIQSNQDYDGFTNNRYCFAGTSSDSVPNGQWFDYHYLSASSSAAQSSLDSCGARTNGRYATPNYAARSTSCSYNIFTNCNSDCWIRYFSTCVGHTVGTLSPCFGYSYP
ncbi:MAG TPA: hypothetical protein VKE22_18305 [Haliangiales bacterium]|nr:hypothetical protein [Haliangiales bacterium]